MNILIAGGTGFLGTALTAHLARHHNIYILTRKTPQSDHQIQWDAKTTRGWLGRLSEMDAVIHLTGYGLEHFPWTRRQKQRFINSRVIPGLVLTEAFEKSNRRPGIFLQASGINRYGLRGATIADESTPPADDFLAQITVQWEDATKAIEALGVRRIITRNAVILAPRGGLFPLMALPVRLFFGGKFGAGNQAVNWMHIQDYVHAVQFLLENKSASGAFNMISPHVISNTEFMSAVAKSLHRPFWFHMPRFLLQIILGEMNILLTEGRAAQPKRLLELGFEFKFSDLNDALHNLLN